MILGFVSGTPSTMSGIRAIRTLHQKKTHEGGGAMVNMNPKMFLTFYFFGRKVLIKIS